MQDFVIREHEAVIQQFVDENKIAISFRKAGEFTIHRLQTGCACKGHKVLEKSIKEKTLRRITISPNPQFVKLSGLIGHWMEKEDPKTGILSVELKGVYLSEFGRAHIQDLINIGIHPLKEKCDTTHELVQREDIVEISETLIDIMQIDVANLATISRNELQYACYFLTGDYDIHDILDMDVRGCANNHIIDEEKAAKLFQDLNEKLIFDDHERGVRRTTTGLLDDEFSYIRHGAQINYPSYMYKCEKGESLVLNVIQADHELMIFECKKEAIVIQNSTQYENWYENHQIVLKSTFKDIGAALNMYFDTQFCSTIIAEAIKEFSFLVEKGAIKIESAKVICDRNFSQGAKDSTRLFYNQLKSDVSSKRKKEDQALTESLHWNENYPLYKKFLDENYHILYKEVRVENATLVKYARDFMWQLCVDMQTKAYIESLH